MTPKRIQLQRKKGWKLPTGTINVARPTKYGNPIVVGSIASISVIGRDDLEYSHSILVTPAIAVAVYRAESESKLTDPHEDQETPHPDDVEDWQRWVAEIEALRGHDLACWCALTEPCHADFLLELSNR
jgi:hypothetical protein